MANPLLPLRGNQVERGGGHSGATLQHLLWPLGGAAGTRRRRQHLQPGRRTKERPGLWVEVGPVGGQGHGGKWLQPPGGVASPAPSGDPRCVCGSSDKLTPLRLLLSIICEVGDPDLRPEALMWLKRLKQNKTKFSRVAERDCGKCSKPSIQRST